MAIYLGSNKEFVSKYFIYDVTPIHEKNASEFPDKLLSVCDVYLGQDIRKENKFGIQFSDEYIVERLRPDCKRIIFPNLVGMGKMMFIQSYYEAGGKNADAAMPYGFFPYGDSVIDRLYEEGYSAEEIIIEIAKGKFFSEEQIRSNFDEMVEQFKKRERNWDVKIVDYILENYRERQVFYDHYHPTNVLYEYIAREILGQLNVSAKQLACPWEQDSYETFVYPEVARALEMKWWNDNCELRKQATSYRFEAHMDYGEWVREYIAWCYERNKG